MSLLGPHAPRGSEFRQPEGGQRALAAHRAAGLVPGEHQLVGAGEEEEEAGAEEGGSAGEEQHQSALSVPARDERRRGRSIEILLASDPGAGSERARQLIGSELLRKGEAGRAIRLVAYIASSLGRSSARSHRDVIVLGKLR